MSHADSNSKALNAIRSRHYGNPLDRIRSRGSRSEIVAVKLHSGMSIGGRPGIHNLAEQPVSFDISKVTIVDQKMECPTQCGNFALVRDYYGGIFAQPNKSVVVLIQCPSCYVKGQVRAEELMHSGITVDGLRKSVIDYLRGKKYEFGGF